MEGISHFDPNPNPTPSSSARNGTPDPRSKFVCQYCNGLSSLCLLIALAVKLPSSIHNTLYTAAFSARCVWRNLGLALNISDADLTAIELNKQKKVEDCFSEMLIRWLQSRNNCYLDFFLQALRLPQVNQAELCTPVKEAVMEELWNKYMGRKRPSANTSHGEPSK